MDAIIPVKAGINSIWNHDNETILETLHDLEERRECASICVAAYQQQTISNREKSIRKRAFEARDLVLKRTFFEEKLKANCEGSIRIVSYSMNGAYCLETPDGSTEQHPWNVAHLKKYYQQRKKGQTFFVSCYYQGSNLPGAHPRQRGHEPIKDCQGSNPLIAHPR